MDDSSIDRPEGIQPVPHSEMAQWTDENPTPTAKYGPLRRSAWSALDTDASIDGQRVAWVRISDLISSGTGRVAGRGIDFEAELARRLRRPADVTRQAIRNRSSALPPLSAFGQSRQPSGRDGLRRP